MTLRNQIQLIAYPDRMGNNLADLYDIIDRHFSRVIGGVHSLPPYPSNADGGFSPLTHKEIDPRYGSRADIEKISGRFDLCLDLTLNHISDESEEFKDFIAKGYESGTPTCSYTSTSWAPFRRTIWRASTSARKRNRSARSPSPTAPPAASGAPSPNTRSTSTTIHPRPMR